MLVAACPLMILFVTMRQIENCTIVESMNTIYILYSIQTSVLYTHLGIPNDRKYKQLPSGLFCLTNCLNTPSFTAAITPSTTNLVNDTKLPNAKNITRYTNPNRYGTNEYSMDTTDRKEVGDVPPLASYGSDDPAMDISI